MSMWEKRPEALALWEEGTALLLSGDAEEAIQLFTRSLEILPTAEAYTFRGWAYSFAGRLDDAIEECRKAIATDPGFGNPYNDIGCYLMQKGTSTRAETWFTRERARRGTSRGLPLPEPRPSPRAARRLSPGPPTSSGARSRRTRKARWRCVSRRLKFQVN